MSFLLTLDEDKLDKIVPLIIKYETMIEKAEPIFKLEGRRLEEIARTLPHYQSSYDQAQQEVKALDEFLNKIKEKRFSKHYRKYNEGYSRQLASRDIVAYIDGEKDIVEINQLIVEVSLTKNKLAAIVEALKQMGWMLSHVTKLRIAEMEDAIL